MAVNPNCDYSETIIETNILFVFHQHLIQVTYMEKSE